MNQHILKELQKLYPKVKIPVESNYQFYINTLCKDKANYSWLPTVIKNLNALEEKTNITTYKFGKSDQIIEWLNKNKNYGSELSFTEQLNKNKFDFVYEKKSFNDFKDSNIYVSIDLIEANWSVYKKYTDICNFLSKDCGESYKTKNFHWFLNKYWSVDIAISQSKSYRQFILGNTNPKKLNHLQEYEMSIIAENLKTILDDNKIVSKNSDELILELSKNEENNSSILNLTLKKDSYKILDDILYCLKHLNSDLPIKYIVYTMDGQKNLGEFVRVKNILDENLNVDKRELFGVIGTRFFMHFRTLILKEELQEDDLYYMNDNFKCKWII